MRGSIKQRSKGTWTITIVTGKDAAGKRIRHYETVTGSKDRADTRLAELIVELSKGTYVKTPRALTVGEYLSQWMASQSTRCRPKTMEWYGNIVKNRLSPELGHIPLSQLRPSHVAQYFAKLRDKGATLTLAAGDYRTLRKALRDAVKLGIVGINACAGVSPPKPQDQDMQVLNPADLGRFLAAVEQAPFPYGALYRTMLYTGLRRNETLALTWGNLDLELCTLRVVNAQCHVNRVFTLLPPKTRAGRRAVDLPPSLAVYLREYRAKVEGQRAMIGKPLTDSDFVFAQVDGSPLLPGTASQTFRKIIRKTGLNIRLHDLRHTYASVMIAAGVNVRTLSQSLGHAQVSTTLNVYSHMFPGAGKTAAADFDRVVSPWVENADNCRQEEDSGEFCRQNADNPF